MDERSIIEQYESLIRAISNHIALSIKGDSNTALQKRFKFDSDRGWAFLTSSMDLLGDTEEAKQNHYRFGLDGPTKYMNLGERYLRLYGVLNAAYLQESAISTIGELFKLKDTKQHTRLHGMKLLQFRHIAGSHTVNYQVTSSSGGRKKIPFMVSRPTLDGDEITVLDDHNKAHDYHLSDLLKEFDSAAQDYLDLVVATMIQRLHPSPSSKARIQYEEELHAIRASRKGAIVLRDPISGRITILAPPDDSDDPVDVE